MRKELMQALIDITDKGVMANLIRAMSVHDIAVLLSILDFTDEATQTRWIDVYNDVFQLT